MNKVDKKIKKKYTNVVRVDNGKFSVYLTLGHQSFCVKGGISRNIANWFRDQLTIALSRTLQEENIKLRKRILELEQTSALLCRECGWRMKFPERPCQNCQSKRKGVGE